MLSNVAGTAEEAADSAGERETRRTSRVAVTGVEPQCADEFDKKMTAYESASSSAPRGPKVTSSRLTKNGDDRDRTLELTFHLVR